MLTSNVFKEIPKHLSVEVNPYVGRLLAAKEEGLPLKFGPMLKGISGQWRQQFQHEPQKLIAEIGIHRGKVFSKMASDFPEFAFVGFDITYKRVVLCAEKAKDLKLTNTCSVFANAKQIHLLFAPQELDGVVIFFPDPWLKKKSQKHNQLINAEFCVNLRSRLAPSGFVWVKTDAAPYFEEICTVMEQAEFKRADQPAGNFPFQNPYSSTFEERFKNKGLPTYEGLWTPREAKVTAEEE